VQLEELDKLKNPMASSGIEPLTLKCVFFLFLLFASCCVSITNNNTNLTVYATIFINLGNTTCFNPNGSSSGVSSYTLFTHWIATSDSHIPINIHMS
jgi:hypothetical protein